MSKAIWVCPSCGQDFTRKTSVVRHISNLHHGGIIPVRYTEYLAGRQSGQYPPIIPERKTKTVAIKAGHMQELLKLRLGLKISAATYPFSDPVAEAIRNFIEVKKTYINSVTKCRIRVYSYHQ